MTTRHEAEVDTALAALWGTEQECYRKLEQDRHYLTRHVGVERKRSNTKRGDWIVTETLEAMLAMPFVGQPYDKPSYDTLVARVAETKATLAAAKAEAAPLEAEFNAKPWSRFFLVNNSNGHIHSSMHCSTCNKFTSAGWSNTSFSWLPTLSGLTEKDAVDEHGTILCSVCFPSAPVEWTLGKAKPVDPDECPGSGTHDHNSSGLSYYSKRAECNHCGQTTSVTSTHKLRKHKTKGA